MAETRSKDETLSSFIPASLYNGGRLLSPLWSCPGIVTSLLVSLLGQARIYVVLGREQLLPSWLATIHKTRDTPINATLFTAVTAGGHLRCPFSEPLYDL